MDGITNNVCGKIGWGERAPPSGTDRRPLHCGNGSERAVSLRDPKTDAEGFRCRTPRRDGVIIPLNVFNLHYLFPALALFRILWTHVRHTTVSSWGKSVSLSHPSSVISTVSSILIPPTPGMYMPGSADTMFPADRTCSDLGLMYMG